MRLSQKTMLKLSEKRQALGEALKKANKEGVTPEDRTAALNEADTLQSEIRQLEIEYRAAVVDEDQEDATGGGDAEVREEHRLLDRASILPFLTEAGGGSPLSGVEAEYRSAVFGDEARSNVMPIDILETRADRAARLSEQRQDAVTPVADSAVSSGSEAGILPRVFTRSIASRLLVSMPSVPVGTATYPIMVSGTTAAMQAPDGEQDAVAGSFMGLSLDPVRLTSRYLFRIEDLSKLRGMEDALRRDLTAVMSDAMDDQIINGDGAAPNVNGFLNELKAQATPGTEDAWGKILEKFLSLVDGLNAYNLSDVRAVVAGKTYRHMSNAFNSNAGQPVDSVYEYLRARMGGISVSSRIPDAVGASGDEAKAQDLIAALTSYPGRNAVAPVWRGIEMIRDPYTGAARGQIAITAVMLWNFKILRDAGWKRIRVRSDA